MVSRSQKALFLLSVRVWLKGLFTALSPARVSFAVLCICMCLSRAFPAAVIYKPTLTHQNQCRMTQKFSDSHQKVDGGVHPDLTAAASFKSTFFRKNTAVQAPIWDVSEHASHPDHGFNYSATLCRFLLNFNSFHMGCMNFA